MAESHRLVTPKKILVKDINDYLACSLCGGYLIDATTVVDCSHTFCRACIVRHFESSRLCPNCGSLVHKSKPLSKLRSDTTLQSLIYKVVPSLYNKELQRRADFYHSTGFRANSSCSDDSILGDRSLDSEEWVISNVGDPSLYFSPDDSISLSVEYYRHEDPQPPKEKPPISDPPPTSKPDNITPATTVKPCEINELTINSDSDLKDKDGKVSTGGVESELSYKRFLQCPAAVRMSHLMKFLRMKFALSNEHRVDIIYSGEVLPPYLSLMDVAYSFKWKRDTPMRFFYLIYIPVARPVVPQQPAPVSVATTPSVPPLKLEIIKSEVKSSSDIVKINSDKIKIKDILQVQVKQDVVESVKNEDNNNVKISVKSVKLPSEKSQNPEGKTLQKSVKFTDNSSSQKASNNLDNKTKSVQTASGENCVYDYSEPDKDEIKAFAERRDREWALQKYADTEIHVSKKRKKNKHSKSEFMYKKRKLHAEITSNDTTSKSDDSLKLKVKLSMPNGHKHKHRTSSNNTANIEPIKTQDLTPKERLLQMRQVRHKHISPPIVEPDKTKQPEIPSLKVVLTQEKTPDAENSEPVAKPASDFMSSGKTLRSDFSNKTSISKDICNKFVRVNLEKCAENKNLATKKSPNSKNEKTEIIPLKITKDAESKLTISPTTVANNSKLANINNKSTKQNIEIKKSDDSITKNNLTITETVKQQTVQTVEPILPAEQKPIIDESKTIENKLNNIDYKSTQSTLVTKNFTVSKIETGTKRKLETSESTTDKRPSLEITVINLVSRSPQIAVQSSSIQTKPATNTQTVNSKSGVSITPEGPPAKKIRPPPLTIPLGRIQKMNNLKANAIQKEKCDIFGALDLSAKPVLKSGEVTKNNEFRSSPKPKISDQLRGKNPSKTGQFSEKRPNISNLQLLSESAVQIREMMVKGSPISTIPNLIKKVPNPQNTPLKSPQNFPNKSTNLLPKNINFPGKNPNFLSKNLQKLPKLNEINKGQFSRLNTTQQVRSPRPTGQNQQVRNIPNPSLFVRQQNQNRINSLNNSANQEAVKTNAAKQNTAESSDGDKKTAENKTSEPPPLKPIESFKK